MAERDLPYSAFNFLVTIDGEDVGGFSDVEGLGTELTVAEYRAGNDAENHVRKIPGMHTVSDVTLKRGVIDSTSIWAWYKEAHTAGPGAKRDVTVTMLDESHSAVQVYRLRGALPTNYTGPTFTAAGGEDVAMEEMVLAIEAFDIESA